MLYAYFRVNDRVTTFSPILVWFLLKNSLPGHPYLTAWFKINPINPWHVKVDQNYWQENHWSQKSWIMGIPLESHILWEEKDERNHWQWYTVLGFAWCCSNLGLCSQGREEHHLMLRQEIYRKRDLHERVEVPKEEPLLFYLTLVWETDFRVQFILYLKDAMQTRNHPPVLSILPDYSQSVTSFRKPSSLLGPALSPFLQPLHSLRLLSVYMPEGPVSFLNINISDLLRWRRAREISHFCLLRAK